MGASRSTIDVLRDGAVKALAARAALHEAAFQSACERRDFVEAGRQSIRIDECTSCMADVSALLDEISRQ